MQNSYRLILIPVIGAVVRGVEEFTFLWGKCVRVPSFFFSHDNSPDVLSDPDDSYQIRETTKVKKAKNINSSGDIGAFFSKPLAPAVDPEEDIVMNEDRVATTSMNSSG
jgi:hypothetical protein